MPRPPKDHVRLNIRINRPLAERAETVKAETGESVTSLIERGLKHVLRTKERKLRQRSD